MSLARLIPLDQKDPDVMEALRTAVERVSAFSGIVRVVLFGSFARNEQNATSNIDLAIILSEMKNLRRVTLDARTAVRGLKWPIDLIVVPQDQYEARKQLGGICFEIESDAVELFPTWNFD